MYGGYTTTPLPSPNHAATGLPDLLTKTSTLHRGRALLLCSYLVGHRVPCTMQEPVPQDPTPWPSI